MAARDASEPRQRGVGNGDPQTLSPGSTMLNAQFPARLSSEAYATLSQLRRELTEKQPGSLSTLGDNVKNIHALICVALRVAFENGSGPISSVAGSEAERHLLDCLDIIQVVVDTAPQTLVENLDPDISGRHTQVPCYAWLLLQLIDLGSRVRLGIVKEKIKGLLELIVHSQNRMYRLSYSRYAISTFLEIMATDILSSLENLEVTDSGSFNIMLPGVAGSVASDMMKRLSFTGDVFSSKLRLGSISQASSTLFDILEAIMPPQGSNIETVSVSAVRQDSVWTINVTRRLWKVVSRWILVCGANLHQELVEIVSPFLRFVLKCIENFSITLKAELSDIQSGKVLLESVATVLSTRSLYEDPALQSVLIECIEGIRNRGRQSTSFKANAEDIVIPEVKRLRHDEDSFAESSKPFQDALASLLETDVPFYADFGAHDGKETRATKRIRLSEPHVSSSEINLFERLVRRAFKLLGCDESVNLRGLSNPATRNFPNLSQQQKSEFLKILGDIPCAAGLSSKDKAQTAGHFHCEICDSGGISAAISLPWQSADFDEVNQTLLSLIPTIARNPSLRVAAMLTARRLLSHEVRSDHLSLKSSAFGEMCLHSLKASSRELRITAGYTLPCFVRKSVEREIRRQNFVIILEYLKSIAERLDVPSQETCVLTLCQLAEASEDEERNIIYLRLLEYFGHTNPYICAVAYTELSKLAQKLTTTVSALLRPFWRSLSITIVKNLQSRPHMAEQLCDLLGMSVDEFLRFTEVHTLPYLVYTRKRDTIARIAAAYHTKSPFDLCMERNNLASILAFLLSQPSQDPEGMIYSFLVDVDTKFHNSNVNLLLKSEPIPISRELLKYIGDAGEDKASRFHHALRVYANICGRKTSSNATASKSSQGIGPFIEEHLLGLITEFLDTVNDTRVRNPISEKKRNIIAIRHMVKLARGHINTAIPQICACLRSALDIEEICDHAFTAWCDLITYLDPEDAEPLVDQSIAIIIRYWKDFQDGAKRGAISLVDHIMRNHSHQMREIFNTLPSLLTIPNMSQFETQIETLKGQLNFSEHLVAFSNRCQSESATVVEQALGELVPFIQQHGELLHGSPLNEQPNSGIAVLMRSLLDCCVKFTDSSEIISIRSAQSLGLIGCLDPNRLESIREKKDILILSNFRLADETFHFALFSLQHVLVDAFLSASRAQGFLAFGMQALMSASQINSEITMPSDDIEKNERHQHWLDLPETVRNTVTPFLTSKYTVTSGGVKTGCSYPLFLPTMSHGEWLRTFVLDLLEKGNGENVRVVFQVFGRIIRGQDISIASFIFPFAVLNTVADGVQEQRSEVQEELTRVLSHSLPEGNSHIRENIMFCSESVFSVLDYLSRWLHGKKKQHATLASHTSGDRVQSELVSELSSAQIKNVEQFLSSIPPEIISKRAVECKSFSRALFHWEQYIRQCRNRSEKQDHVELESLYQRLQDIYTQIDEPDGIDGISAHLHVLNIDQQILEHRRAGRWTAAQSWYELQLDEERDNNDAQLNLLTCLKQSGQQDALLNQFDGFQRSGASSARLLPFAVEASIMTAKWPKLNEYLQLCSKENVSDFTIGIGSALNALRLNKKAEFDEIIHNLRHTTAKAMTFNSTTSLQSCHDSLLHLHALAEVEAIVNASPETRANTAGSLDALSRRLDILGVYITEKQYLLGLRRAAMELSDAFSESDIATMWLTSARLSRKNDHMSQAYQSIMHAAQLKDNSATIEHARLLWRDGHHRKAIQTLKGAITTNAFVSHDYEASYTESVPVTMDREHHQNMLAARAHLLVAKWTDRAGQTHSEAIVDRYREAIKLRPRWEKAYYYLGKHYNKLIDTEKAKPPEKQAQSYVSGESSKLAIENYLRSLANGNKYVFQSLPKVLTIWLEHAASVDQTFDPRRGNNIEFQNDMIGKRKKSLEDMHSQVRKYINRMPAVSLFTILPQVVARICHSNPAVFELLTRIVVKTVTSFPAQGLWTVLALFKSSSKDRASRGITCLQKITEATKKSKLDISPSEMRALINQGQKFSEELLRLCTARVEDKVSRVSLARHLGFNHRVAPCQLVVPFQTMLTPILPSNHEPKYLKEFKSFPGKLVTVERVLDEALVLSSLQKPRKISIQGSDGKIYSLLCKPKDDLRKDQRLMEFNNMINRFLKKDIEATKRRMYIKTYSVTPLNEECGLIEWVDNLRTLREIVIKLLRERGVVPNYNEIRHYLNEACANKGENVSVFTTHVLAKFPPVLHEWLVEMFPDTGAWFAARLRYTRSCAVMSMVGYVLGLGDRHGENILFEEGTGGILHVDFNCLFDKGLTFDKPEVVPFRLTHNMIDAFGAYKYNGPFRRTCEITLGLLRQNEDALMTILETFLYDPTTDFIGKKRRTHEDVPETPEGVLECVRHKLRGLLPKESIPLSVDGHVDQLIMQATDRKNLASMYIGWCAFF